MDPLQKQKYLDYLLAVISENKQSKFRRLIQYRTRYVTVVLEDIYQPHNASAVLRTCDCFGIQDVHIIENKNKYSINPDVALGSAQWLTIMKYNQVENNTIACLNALKDMGYTLVATSPHTDTCTLDELPLDRKTALLFGTELTGLSHTALGMADSFVRIPIVGFTESFNISVSAALCLYALTQKLRESSYDWQLNESEKTDVMTEWAKQVVKRPDLLEKEFINSWMK